MVVVSSNCRSIRKTDLQIYEHENDDERTLICLYLPTTGSKSEITGTVHELRRDKRTCSGLAGLAGLMIVSAGTREISILKPGDERGKERRAQQGTAGRQRL